MERRQHRRVPYGAWIEDLSRAGSLRFYLSRDLSLGGLLLRAPDPPPIGSKLRLRLVVENEKRSVSLEGEVVRHQDEAEGNASFAVCFTALSDEHRGFLDELVQELSQKADD